MERKNIPGTELEASPISLGGVPIGSKLTEMESFRLMDAYSERGGNMIDTAEVYANWLPIEPSISESTIGKWMKARGNRSELIVTTKGAHPLLNSMHVSRMSKEDIERDVEGSLRRLQVETIDLYWLHRDDSARPAGEIMETLNSLVKKGSIRYFGCSNWTAPRIKEAQEYAQQHGLQRFSANQMMWSAAEADPLKLQDTTCVTMDAAAYRFHLGTGLPAIPYSSQAQGLFTKWDTGSYTADDSRIAPQYRSERNRKRYEAIKSLVMELSATVNQIALAYLCSQPFLTIPIAGCYTVEHLNDSLKAAQIALTPEQIRFIDVIPD